MNGITSGEWRKYGRHRGYASDANGATLGFVDLQTGAVTLEPRVAPEPTTSLLLAWAAAFGAEPATASDPDPELAESEWHDLANNRPGHGVRAMREAEWQASKERSRLVAYGERAFGVHTQERAWRKGAEGEEYVGFKLEKLRKHGWHVLHSIPVGSNDSDIDHVVIGPGGVFTINSKNHAGKKIWVADYAMMVDGHKVPYLRNAKYEAERSARLLTRHLDFDVPVRGCIVVLTGSFVPEVKYKSRPVAASVLTKWDVPTWFRRQPHVLTAEQVEAVYEIARRSTTWS